MLTTANPIGVVKRDERKELKPFQIPEYSENDELFEFVTALKSDCPIESVTIGFVTFSKKVFPSAWSDRNRSEEYFAPQLICRKMTQVQADAIMKRAEVSFERIPSRRNPAWTINSPDEVPEYFSEFEICVKDYLILSRRESFNPYRIENDVEVEKEVQEPVGSLLLSENAKRAKKDKVTV